MIRKIELKWNAVLATLGFGLAATLAPVAYAQDEAADEAATEETVMEPASSDDGDGPGFRRVADEEETIFAVQRKAYLIKNRFEASLMFAALLNDRFVESYAPVGSVTYYLGENFGIEAFGGYFFPSESDATTELFDTLDQRPEFARLTQMLWAAGLGAQWSPIYGKLKLGKNVLGNFSFYVTGGFAVGQSRVECIPNSRLDPNRGGVNATCPAAENELDPEVVYEPATFRPMGVFGGGTRFYFNNWLAAKIEVRDYVFASRVYRPEDGEPTSGSTSEGVPGNALRYSDSIRHNVFANFGISILFGGGSKK